jgi:hypothetical protein
MGIWDYKLRPSSSPPTCLDVSVKKTKIKNQKQIQNSLSLSLSLKVLYIYIYICTISSLSCQRSALLLSKCKLCVEREREALSLQYCPIPALTNQSKIKSSPTHQTRNSFPLIHTFVGSLTILNLRYSP